MKQLPEKEILDDINDSRPIEEIVKDWMEVNRMRLHTLSLAACEELVKYPEVYSVPFLEFMYVLPTTDEEELIAELGIDRESMFDALDDCQEWFVEMEEYELAAAVVKCRAKLENKK